MPLSVSFRDYTYLAPICPRLIEQCFDSVRICTEGSMKSIYFISTYSMLCHYSLHLDDVIYNGQNQPKYR